MRAFTYDNMKFTKQITVHKNYITHNIILNNNITVITCNYITVITLQSLRIIISQKLCAITQ